MSDQYNIVGDFKNHVEKSYMVRKSLRIDRIDVIL